MSAPRRQPPRDPSSPHLADEVSASLPYLPVVMLSDDDLAAMTPTELADYLAALHAEQEASRLNRYVPHIPTPTQAPFVYSNVREAFYGGAAGGGKSDALLMCALRYVDHPTYSAILFRRTFKDLALPGALMSRSHEWLDTSDARWNSNDYTWRFPSGATLSFGYLQNEKDRFRYMGAEFQFCGFDELTQFDEAEYRYLFSRLRRATDMNVPLRMRSASNPGGVGHGWVRTRFLESASEDRIFIPAKLEDNPFLDQDEYDAMLAELDPVTRAQLRHGDWSVRPAGGYFDRAWFHNVDVVGPETRTVRWWDLAATPEGDYTVGLRMGRTADRTYCVSDVTRMRGTPQQVETQFRATTVADTNRVEVYMEQEPGSAGVAVIANYRRLVDDLPNGPYVFRGVRSTGSKLDRAKPVSAATADRRISLVLAPWNIAFLDEVEAFPEVDHDDQADAFAGAYSVLAGGWVPIVAPLGSRKASYWRGERRDV